MNDKSRDSRVADERRGATIQRLAEQYDVSTSLIKRAISWGRIKVLYFGDRPIIGPEERDRIAREGLPDVPTGYRRQTKGPWPGGRPRKDKATAKVGNAKAASKATPPRRNKREPERRAAPSD